MSVLSFVREIGVAYYYLSSSGILDIKAYTYCHGLLWNIVSNFGLCLIRCRENHNYLVLGWRTTRLLTTLILQAHLRDLTKKTFPWQSAIIDVKWNFSCFFFLALEFVLSRQVYNVHLVTLTLTGLGDTHHEFYAGGHLSSKVDHLNPEFYPRSDILCLVQLP